MTDKKKKWDYEKKAYVPIGTGGQEPWWKNRKKTKIYKAEGGRVGLTYGGAVGIQTHVNKLASGLNTQPPDHSVYLNEDGYLKGGIKVRS